MVFARKIPSMIADTRQSGFSLEPEWRDLFHDREIHGRQHGEPAHTIVPATPVLSTAFRAAWSSDSDRNAMFHLRVDLGYSVPTAATPKSRIVLTLLPQKRAHQRRVQRLAALFHLLRVLGIGRMFLVGFGLRHDMAVQSEARSIPPVSTTSARTDHTGSTRSWIMGVLLASDRQERGSKRVNQNTTDSIGGAEVSA